MKQIERREKDSCSTFSLIGQNLSTGRITEWKRFGIMIYKQILPVSVQWFFFPFPCSIHTPRARDDHIRFSHQDMLGISIHVPRARDDVSRDPMPRSYSIFQSTSLVRGTTLCLLKSRIENRNSIHVPRARDDRLACSFSFPITISIHVPRARDDLAWQQFNQNLQQFQSTSLVRGTTRLRGQRVSSLLFQSTSLVRGTTFFRKG